MGISSFHPHGEGGAACIFHLTCGHAEVPRGQETTCSQQRFSSCWSGVWGQGPVHPARSIIECRQPRFQWVGGGVGVFLHLNSPDSPEQKPDLIRGLYACSVKSRIRKIVRTYLKDFGFHFLQERTSPSS